MSKNSSNWASCGAMTGNVKRCPGWIVDVRRVDENWLSGRF